jgi:hypothetical protein
LSANKTQYRNEQDGYIKKTEKSRARGFFYLITSSIIFLCIPLVIIWFVQNRTSMFPIDALLDVLILGIIISIISFLAGYTQRGSRLHAGAFLLLIVFVCAYFWYLLDGGVLSFTMQDFALHLEFPLIMYWLLAIGVIFGIPYIQMLLNPKPPVRSKDLKTRTVTQDE